MTLDLSKVWWIEKYNQDRLPKKFGDSTNKENVTVTSSVVVRNDGTIRILTHFMAKNYSKLLISDKILL